MAVAAFTFLSSEVMTGGSLGAIALANRRHLMEQSTEGQILAFLRHLRRQPKAESDPTMVCGEPDALLIPCTSKFCFHSKLLFSFIKARKPPLRHSNIVY